MIQIHIAINEVSPSLIELVACVEGDGGTPKEQHVAHLIAATVPKVVTDYLRKVNSEAVERFAPEVAPTNRINPGGVAS